MPLDEYLDEVKLYNSHIAYGMQRDIPLYGVDVDIYDGSWLSLKGIDIHEDITGLALIAICISYEKTYDTIFI